MITLDTKVYVQLQPDDATIALLKNIQQLSTNSSSARIVDTKALHLTVLHIGTINTFLRSIKSASPEYSEEHILHKIDSFTKDLIRIVAFHGVHAFQLKSTKATLFGTKHSTYVLSFEPSHELVTLHKKCLALLQKLLKECGINNPKAWMRTDNNLQNALTLRPHVTLIKNYSGLISNVPESLGSFKLMPVLYDGVPQ